MVVQPGVEVNAVPYAAAAEANRRDPQAVEEGDADAAPMTANLSDRSEVHLQQHGNDHQPDEHGDRQVDVSNLGASDGMKDAGQQMAERHADDDAERDPQGQGAFEQ